MRTRDIPGFSPQRNGTRRLNCKLVSDNVGLSEIGGDPSVAVGLVEFSLDYIFRIDTLWHEGLFSQEVMRFSHLPLEQQNMPHMEKIKSSLASIDKL